MPSHVSPSGSSISTGMGLVFGFGVVLALILLAFGSVKVTESRKYKLFSHGDIK